MHAPTDMSWGGTAQRLGRSLVHRVVGKKDVVPAGNAKARAIHVAHNVVHHLGMAGQQTRRMAVSFCALEKSSIAGQAANEPLLPRRRW